MSSGSGCSIVIPAHDEEAVLGRLLESLEPLARQGFAVIVVPNGCTDDTEGVARRAGWARTVPIETASKTAALNAGIDAAGPGPCIFIDADISVPEDALRALATVIQGAAPLAASLRVRFETEGRPWTVRAFYRVFSALPYATDRLLGLGLYALSAAGMQRLGRFPPLTADDLYVQRLFAPEERLVLHDHVFTVAVPRTVAALLRVRTRIASGNAELTTSVGGELGRSSTRHTVRALLDLVLRRPARLPEVLDYLVITVAARIRARAVARRAGIAWERDSTTR